MSSQIKHIAAIKILEEYKTEGSHPLKVIGDDDNLYVAKFTDQKHPYLELINEVICGGLAKGWGLHVPEMAIISFPPEVVADFQFSKRYKDRYFNEVFFGSQLIEPALDLSEYIGGVKKGGYQAFENPLDWLKIGCFDHWIGNKDRKPENPNIILSVDEESGKFRLHPIDHAAAFAYLPYSEVRDIMLRLDKSVMQCGFAKSISVYGNSKMLENLHKNIEISILNSLKEIDHVFDLVPKAWGFSKKSKAKLKDFLGDKVRNERISKTYLSYLKK